MSTSKTKTIVEHEAFALLLAQGWAQNAAFLQIRPHASKWKPQSVYEKASKLKAKLAPRIEELRLALQGKVMETVAINEAMVRAGLYAEATYRGEGSSHSARVSAWAHLADREWPVPKAEQPPSGPTTNILMLGSFTDEQLRALLGRME